LTSPQGICCCSCLFCSPPQNPVISTEATDSLTVRCAVEKPALSEVEGNPAFRLIHHVSKVVLPFLIRGDAGRFAVKPLNQISHLSSITYRCRCISLNPL
jgi:hypothetical protein